MELLYLKHNFWEGDGYLISDTIGVFDSESKIPLEYRTQAWEPDPGNRNNPSYKSYYGLDEVCPVKESDGGYGYQGFYTVIRGKLNEVIKD